MVDTYNGLQATEKKRKGARNLFPGLPNEEVAAVTSLHHSQEDMRTRDVCAGVHIAAVAVAAGSARRFW